MFDIATVIKKSFRLLKERPLLLLPVLCAVALPIILAAFMIQYSGAGAMLAELSDLADGYIAEVGLQTQEDFEAGFWTYAAENGFHENRFLELITKDNLIAGGVCLIMWMIGSFYFTCMSYAAISLAIKKKGFDRLIIRTNHFVLRLFSLRILLTLLIIIPAIIILINAIILSFVNGLLALFSTLLLLILFIAYVLFINVRLFFAAEDMYIDDVGPIDAMKHTFAMSRSHILQIIAIFFIIYAINAFYYTLKNQPFMMSFSSAMISPDILTMIISGLIVMVFVMIETIVFTLEHIFLFYSYIDLKD